MTGQRQRGRKGEDPEGGERSAWKGFVGPSGLGLDHAKIPEVEKKVYDTLLPLVFRAEHPIPLSQFTQAACDVLLPLLPSSGEELSEHAFKSQWGRLNEFVCPKLAEMRGLGDCCFNRTDKTVLLSIACDPPPGFTPTSSRVALGAAGKQGPEQEGGEEEEGGGGRAGRRRGGRGGRRERGDAAPAAEPANGGPHSAGGGVQPTVIGAVEVPSSSVVPVPADLAAPAAGAAGAAQAPEVQYHAVLPQLPQGLCLYCGQGYHVIKQCPDFHAMLQSIYQAGYQQGVAAAQQAQQAQQLTQYPQVPAGSAPLQYS